MRKVAKKDLKRSGIAVQDAYGAGMYSVDDASEIFEEFKAEPALIIPYIDPWTDHDITFKQDGKDIPFCRIRYLNTPPKVQSFKKKKFPRYSQPKNSGVHPYFPVVEDLDWVAIAEDTDIPIMITEGEKKALAASLAGVPTIGLGGVYNFTHDGELLPMLENIKWSGRVVYICYDSDAVGNNKIQAAEGRLSTELSLKRNASVFLVRLPDLPGGAKMGVDDFIVAKGVDALFVLLDSAPEMRKIDREVLRMNAEVAWIAKDGLLLDLRTDNWIKKSDFIKGSDFSTRTVTVPNAKANGLKVISIANEFLTHPLARRYADTVFAPGTDAKAIKLPGGGIGYNRFRGLEGEEGDVEPFFELYDWLMSKTDEFDYDLIWKIFCYKVQNLAKRIDLGLILLGSQGSGKSFFCKILSEMVYPYGTTISTSELGSDYNGWLETSLIVIMNEAKSVQLKYNMDKIKTYITEKRQSCNEKYRPSRQVDSYGFYTFTSNERSAGAFPDGDRRMVVVGCPNEHPDGEAFYDYIGEWYDNGGPKKLLHYFQNYDLEGWTPPSKAPQTREKRMAYFASLTPIQKVGDAMQKADENLIGRWIIAAMTWAASEQVGSNPQQIETALKIASTMMHIHIRPFYTPEELALMFPAISGTLSMGKVKDATPANILAQQLVQGGIQYLKCTDNFDGFVYRGQVRQFLVISEHDKYSEPISQRHFDDLMDNFPTFKDWKADKKETKRQSKRKSKRKLDKRERKE